MVGKDEKPVVFVDRDGTLCYDKHYLADPNGLELIPTVVDGLKKLTEAGFPIIIITNQSGVARGYFTEERLTEIHARLRSMLAEHGVIIKDIFHCPHMPNSGCDCRKPATGMIVRASEKYSIDLSNSFVIGDRMMDIEMAHAVGAKGILVPEEGDQYKVDQEIAASPEKPDFLAKTFHEAVLWIAANID